MAASDRHSGNPFPLRSFLISARARGRRDLLARAPAAWEPSDLGTHREWMMMKRMTWAGAAAVALLMATFGAGNLQAQASTTSTNEGDRIAKAEKLESQARDAASDRESFGAAIRLYREAADLRGDDPGAIDDLIMAGKLAYYVGHKGQAVDSKENRKGGKDKGDGKECALQVKEDAQLAQQLGGEYQGEE